MKFLAAFAILYFALYSTAAPISPSDSDASSVQIQNRDAEPLSDTFRRDAVALPDTLKRDAEPLADTFKRDAEPLADTFKRSDQYSDNSVEGVAAALSETT